MIMAKTKNNVLEGKNIFDERTQEWAVKVGDVVFAVEKLWIVTRIGKTSLHDHKYIKILGFYENIWGDSIKKEIRIYSHEAGIIESFYKIERKK
jgi:hypothetical protein